MKVLYWSYDVHGNLDDFLKEIVETNDIVQVVTTKFSAGSYGDQYLKEASIICTNKPSASNIGATGPR